MELKEEKKCCGSSYDPAHYKDPVYDQQR